MNYDYHSVGSDNVLTTNITIYDYPRNILLLSVEPVLDNNGLNMYSSVSLSNAAGTVVYFAKGGEIVNPLTNVNVDLDYVVRDAYYPNMTLKFTFVDTAGVTFYMVSSDPIIEIDAGAIKQIVSVPTPIHRWGCSLYQVYPWDPIITYDSLVSCTKDGYAQDLEV
jgi:hypothetical protein